MNKYKLSVIIPSYNCSDDIERAINSIINQTIKFENIELIIVDDNSTDNTRKVIKDYSSRYDNIKLILLDENSGSAGKPRNIGIDEATSDYLMFLDNDDTYQDYACEMLYNIIIKENCNMVVCNNTDDIYNKNDIKYYKIEKPDCEIINVKENPDYLFNIKYPSTLWNKIFNRNFIIKNNIKCLEGLPEDNYFTYQCYLIEENILFLKNATLYNHYFYRTTGESVSTQMKPIYIYKEFTVFKILNKLISSYKNSEKFLITFIDFFINFIIWNIIITQANKEVKYQLFDLLNETIESYSNILHIKFKPHIIFYKLIVNDNYLLAYYYSLILQWLIKINREHRIRTGIHKCRHRLIHRNKH